MYLLRTYNHRKIFYDILALKLITEESNGSFYVPEDIQC